MGGVGVSNGLSSLVQVHHIGTEDVHVVLALEKQPLRAPLLADRQETCRCLGDTCSIGKACSSLLVLPGLCWEEGLSSFPSHTHFAGHWSQLTLRLGREEPNDCDSLISLSELQSLSRKGRPRKCVQLFETLSCCHLYRRVTEEESQKALDVLRRMTVSCCAALIGWTLVVGLRLEDILFGGQHGKAMRGMRTNTGQRSANINLFLEDFPEEGSSKGCWEVWLHRVTMVMLWEGKGVENQLAFSAQHSPFWPRGRRAADGRGCSLSSRPWS